MSATSTEQQADSPHPESSQPGVARQKGRRATLRGRPELYTDYAADQAMLNTRTKKWSVVLLVLVMLVAPFFISRDWQGLLTLVFIFAIGGIGMNLITGFAGQVSLGHAFFLGLGAYTAAYFGGLETSNVRGLELEMWIWLPLAGIVPMLVGLAVAPLAARVRGLYLAILTLGLVFIGEHIWKEMRTFTGGPGIGRRGAEPVIGGFHLYERHTLFGIDFDRETFFYLACLLLLVVLAIAARNLARSRMGRAFAAVRDRDIAAEIMGVPLMRTKVLAFGISSFYAGIAGGLLGVAYGQITGERFNLLLSVDFLAIILIGGIATISGSIIGATFIVLMPRAVEWLADHVPFVGTAANPGILSVFQLQLVLFGALIIAVLIFEPRGIFGLWLRIRNYWKAWPFSY
jgi:branched-chain amino acid transport system permease protein